MSMPISTLHYPSTLDEFAVPEKEYLRQHPEYDYLCTGVVVFGNDGKLLLVQRAANEKAFPDLWVSWPKKTSRVKPPGRQPEHIPASLSLIVGIAMIFEAI